MDMSFSTSLTRAKQPSQNSTGSSRLEESPALIHTMLMMARGRKERMILLNMLIARTLLIMNNYINYSYYSKH